MEVHHHAHTQRKKWTHYFWEFLMLFLAVFCGFMAENQREHYVEGKREREFMGSMVKDLELDTLQFSRVKNFRLNRLQTIDSIILFFVNHPVESVSVREYSLAINLFGHRSFFQNSGTLDQLKNSGGLRLIRHRNVVDSIQSYDQQIKRIALRDIYETDFAVDHNRLLQQLFDGKTLLKIFADSIYYNKPSTQTALVKMNQQYLNEFLNSLRTFRSLVQQDGDLQTEIKAKATRLIALINKEYHLK